MKPFYTLDDLLDRSSLDDGHSLPAKLAVLGYPIAHSASPVMHQAALDHYGFKARYIRLEVPPNQIPTALDRLKTLGFIGCNITVPHKLAALEYCDEVHPTAQLLGAVNTIRFDADATRGFNTDAPGFASAILQDFSAPLESFSVFIAGAGGGAGMAIATQCALLGCPVITLANRTLDKIQPLADSLKKLSPSSTITAIALDDPSLPLLCSQATLIINTSSLGLKPTDPPILPASTISPSAHVYDTIYNPPATPLLQLAQSLSCPHSNGFSMLLHQGALAFQLWFPNTNPLPLMQSALSKPHP